MKFSCVNPLLAALVFSTMQLAWSNPMEVEQTKVNKQVSVDFVNSIIQKCEHSATCVLKEFADYVTKTQQELAFETTLREKMAEDLEKYACDHQTVSSEPIRTTTWNEFNVSIMHELPTSKIHLLEGFISSEECQAILESVEKTKMNQATVSGGKKFSSVRKAMQSNVEIPWNQEDECNQIALFARRVYDYTNHVLEGLDIQEHGQSSLKYLLYSGRGRQDAEPDHYAAHCDGSCDGSLHTAGARVATMVAYCQTAEDGGHTHFLNAGVHIAAKPGDALFFSYIDPKTLQMDNGFSVHSGCPVYSGTKQVVTQWMRLGVDEEHPYNSFRNF